MKAKKDKVEIILKRGRKNRDKIRKGFYFMLLCMKKNKE